MTAAAFPKQGGVAAEKLLIKRHDASLEESEGDDISASRLSFRTSHCSRLIIIPLKFSANYSRYFLFFPNPVIYFQQRKLMKRPAGP